MKKKINVLIITFFLLLSGMLGAVGGEVADDRQSFGKESEKTDLKAAQEIHDWYDLDEIRNGSDGDYVLINDLDETTDGYGDLIDTTDGWEPIGNPDTPFTGTFDGNGYEIQDLYINRTDEKAVGLFGVTDGAELTEVGVVDADVKGGFVVGGVAGDNGGKIYGSYTTGYITSTSGGVGGLAGHNSGSISNSYSTGAIRGDDTVLGGEKYEGTIFGSYATLDVEGDGVGGLLGYNTGTVSTSYATGDVTDLDFAPEIGGLVGENKQGPIFDSYATSDVNGTDHVGGLVGYLYDSTVSNSYATGKVRGKDTIGGLVGESYECTIENSFWDIETSGMNTSAGGTGKTTAEMKDVSTYTDTATEGLKESWDFAGDPNDDGATEDIWGIDENGTINDGYPFFTWEEEPEVHVLTINTVGEGSTTPEEGSSTYEKGTEVTVEAMPAKGWYFNNWTGDYEGEQENQTINITMDKDKEVTAHFEEIADEYNLTINIEGEGSTTPEEGNHTYDEGEVVTVEAMSAEGWYFNNWTGDYGGEQENECINITMDEDKEVTAHFKEHEAYFEVEIIDYDEEVKIGEDITVEYSVINTGGFEGTQDIVLFLDGDAVKTKTDITLKTGEEYESEFTWEAEESGEQEFEVRSSDDASHGIIMIKETVSYTLTANIEGEGEVDIDPDENKYENGTKVTLTAVPEEGWYFEEWTGDHTGSEKEITITMNDDKNITATFEEVKDDEHLLTIAIEGEGSTEPEPGDHVFGDGREVAIEATPDEGWKFVGWTGDYEGTEEEITLTMDEDKEVTAHFEEREPAYFEVEIIDYDKNVKQGENITVKYKVTNTGGLEDTQDIGLNLDGEEIASHDDLDLGPGEEHEGEFTVEYDEIGEHRFELVSSDDTSEEKVVAVEEKTSDNGERSSDDVEGLGFISDHWWLLLVLLIGIIAAAVLIFMMKGEEEKEEEESVGEEMFEEPPPPPSGGSSGP